MSEALAPGDSPQAATARVATAEAAMYLVRLCAHFRQECWVTRGSDRRGGAGARIAFPAGSCDVAVVAGGRALELCLRAVDAASLALLEDVLARPLRHFAFAEGLEVRWHPIVPPFGKAARQGVLLSRKENQESFIP